MRRVSLFAIGMAALVSMFAGAMPAFAQYGAIAYDRGNCAWGRSWNYSNPEDAAARALSECGWSNCQVLVRIGPHQCGALAATASCSGYGWATRSSAAEAQLVAMQECQKYNSGQCTLKVSDCNN